MPIKFRCEHCNQLMGIARRKAGSQVQCTNCHKPVTVPVDDPAESPVAAVGPKAAAVHAPAVAAPAGTAKAPPPPFPGLFEQNDIDDLLRPAQVEMQPRRQPIAAAAPAVPAWSTPANFDVEPVSINGQSLAGVTSVGFLITPRRATLLIVLGLLLLGAAFGAGVCVGRYLLG